MKKTFQTLLGLFLVIILLTGCWSRYPFHYSAEPIEGWIVDEETGKPLKDVIVVTQWIYDSKLQPLQGSESILTAMETITDEKGYFYLPKWGPKAMSEGSFIPYSPKLIFFKPKYHWKELYTPLKPYKQNKSNTKSYSDWHNRIIKLRYQVPQIHSIKLKVFKGDLDEYAADLGGINESLVILALPQTYCGWKMIPNMVQALEQQRIIFEMAKINSILRSFEHLSAISHQSCGSIHAFFKRFNSIRR